MSRHMKIEYTHQPRGYKQNPLVIFLYTIMAQKKILFVAPLLEEMIQLDFFFFQPSNQINTSSCEWIIENVRMLRYTQNRRKKNNNFYEALLLGDLRPPMALSELQLVIFGDSWSDGGYLGEGIGAEGGSNDPMEEVFCGPIRKIGEHFGSKFHLKECGYYEGCPSDGLTWPYHVGVKKVMNFACSGATSCQYVEKYVEVPPGYVAMPQSECLLDHRYHSRGVAQQIQWAAKILPQEIWERYKRLGSL